MPLDAGTFRRPLSPGFTDEVYAKKDKTYRKYAASIERVLAAFDNALQEWADYISFLGRLLKALQSRPSGVGDVPYSIIVAKRLAQCLDPKLPSGVHQKALEVYNFVFSILGKDGLSKELTLYLPGISPALSFASLSVKPAILSIFEDYIVTLDVEILQPALKAVILALLPGLEEETSDEFERVYTLLNKLRRAVSREQHHDKSDHVTAHERCFWQSLFLATITSQSRRLGALQYLIRDLPNLATYNKVRRGSEALEAAENDLSPESQAADVEAIVSPEPGLLVRCLAAGLKDDQILVQRGFLDLLVTKVPLSSGVLQSQIKPDDLDLLIAAATFVVTRREMSLNRRLWTWFLGPDTSKETEVNGTSRIEQGLDDLSTPGLHLQTSNKRSYFEAFGLSPLSRSLLKMITSSPSLPTSRARPFRMCLSLMDRSEIGSLVVPRIFIPLMESIWEFEKVAASSDAFSEVLRSANVFFDGVQSQLIWTELCGEILKAMQTQSSNSEAEDDAGAALRRLELLWFILTKFNVREEEMLIFHLPRACLILLLGIQSLVSLPDFPRNPMQREIVKAALRNASRMFDLMPERALEANDSRSIRSPSATQFTDIGDRRLSDIEDVMQSFARDSAPSRTSTVPLISNSIPQSLISLTTTILLKVLETESPKVDLEGFVIIIAKLFRKLPSQPDFNHGAFAAGLLRGSSTLLQASATEDTFPAIGGFISTFEFLNSISQATTWTAESAARQITENLMKTLWSSFSPDQPQHIVEAVRYLWRIHSVTAGSQLVESIICSLMIRSSENLRECVVSLDGARRFAMIWNQTTSKARSAADRRSSLGRKKKGLRKALNETDELDILARPLTLVLDSLSDPKSPPFAFIASWLNSLSSMQIILDFLVHRLQSTQYIVDSQTQQSSSTVSPGNKSSMEPQATRECLYYVQRISDILRICPENVSGSLQSEVISAETMPSHKVPSIEPEEAAPTTLNYLTSFTFDILDDCLSSGQEPQTSQDLSKATIELLQQLMQSSFQGPYRADHNNKIIQLLMKSIQRPDVLVQQRLMEIFTISKSGKDDKPDQEMDITGASLSQTPRPIEKRSASTLQTGQFGPLQALSDCLIQGLTSPKTRPFLDVWIKFLTQCLPLYGSQLFQILIPLVECFRKSSDEVFEGFKAIFADAKAPPLSDIEPINTITLLLNGLELTIGHGHEQLLRDEVKTPLAKVPEQSQSFFGNMVSGVFVTEGQKSRAAIANDRLTVLICFKDSVRLALSMWSWGDSSASKTQLRVGSSASFSYASIRLRNRSRRVLEHLLSTEALESLETLIETTQPRNESGRTNELAVVLNLLHALDASRPKNTMPTIFNAIYSRTSPQSLDARRTSTLTSDLSDLDVVSFLVAYTRSIDDDALDEIWVDCMAFLKDVLANPMPQRQILPKLLEFVAILGQKIDNTNFGEQRRMRKEISDIFVRLMAATFTVRPLAFSQEPVATADVQHVLQDVSKADEPSKDESRDDVVKILASILPIITSLLVDTDRMIAAATTLSTQVLGPTFRSRKYPKNITPGTLDILKTLSKIPEVSKIWKKDVAEAFNDSRFFNIASSDLVRNGWMPIIKQWLLIEKDKMPDILIRLTAPASAGIMFGVGATSARLEADRKTQLNLRRIAFLLLAADVDNFLINIDGIQEKLIELFNATTSSSPSSVTRAEIFMVLRAMLLQVSPVHLSSVWPVVSTELHTSLISVLDWDPNTSLNIEPILQAAKLLDLLLTLSPDDFQLRQWLFVTDTIDAIYRTANWQPTALVDRVSDQLDNTPAPSLSQQQNPQHHVNNTTATTATPTITTTATFLDPTKNNEGGIRRPLLRWEIVRGIPRDQQMIERILRPFLSTLSITAFESTYHMETADRQACVDDLLRDLFEESTLV